MENLKNRLLKIVESQENEYKEVLLIFHVPYCQLVTQLKTFFFLIGISLIFNPLINCRLPKVLTNPYLKFWKFAFWGMWVAFFHSI